MHPAALCAALAIAAAPHALAEPGAPARAAATIQDLEPRTGLPVGFAAPDAPVAHVVDSETHRTTLHELFAAAEGPVVIVFYRGGWCPFCTRQLADLQRYLPELQEAGVTLIAISPEAPEHLTKTAEDTGAEYLLLSDESFAVANAYNLTFALDERTIGAYRGYGIDLAKWNAAAEWKLPVPAAFVLDRDNKVVFAHVDEDYRERVDAAALVQAAKDAAR